MAAAGPQSSFAFQDEHVSDTLRPLTRDALPVLMQVKRLMKTNINSADRDQRRRDLEEGVRWLSPYLML